MQEGVNQETLSDVLAALLAAFPIRFGISKEDIKFDQSFDEIAKGDIHIASHALMDIHEVLELELNYMPFTEFEKFRTVSDIVEYFYIELLRKRGIL